MVALREQAPEVSTCLYKQVGELLDKAPPPDYRLTAHPRWSLSYIALSLVMPSLAILVASFLSTFTLAAAMPGPGPAIRNTNLCSGQTLSGDIPFTNDVTFTLLSVSKVDANVHTRLALRTPAGKGPGEAWLVVCTLSFWSLRPQSEINETVLTNYM